MFADAHTAFSRLSPPLPCARLLPLLLQTTTMEQKEAKPSKTCWSIHNVMMAVDVVCWAVALVTGFTAALGMRLMTIQQIGRCYFAVMVVMSVHCVMTVSTRYQKSLDDKCSVWIIRAVWVYAVEAWATVVMFPPQLSPEYIEYFDAPFEWVHLFHSTKLNDFMVYHGAWCMVLTLIVMCGFFVMAVWILYFYYGIRTDIHLQCYCVRVGIHRVATPRPGAHEEEEKTASRSLPSMVRERHVSSDATTAAAHADAATDT